MHLLPLPYVSCDPTSAAAPADACFPLVLASLCALRRRCSFCELGASCRAGPLSQVPLEPYGHRRHTFCKHGYCTKLNFNRINEGIVMHKFAAWLLCRETLSLPSGHAGERGRRQTQGVLAWRAP